MLIYQRVHHITYHHLIDFPSEHAGGHGCDVRCHVASGRGRCHAGDTERSQCASFKHGEVINGDKEVQSPIPGSFLVFFLSFFFLHQIAFPGCEHQVGLEWFRHVLTSPKCPVVSVFRCYGRLSSAAGWSPDTSPWHQERPLRGEILGPRRRFQWIGLLGKILYNRKPMGFYHQI